METKFTEQESLAVIREMINQARNNIQKGSANSMIFWGCAVALASVLNFILLHVLEDQGRQSYWVWCLMIPAAFASYFIRKKNDRTALAKTHIDRIIGGVWIAFGISVVLFVVIIYSLAFGWENYQMFLLITPGIMLMTGLAQFTTATASRYNPFFFGAAILWLGAIGCLVSFLVFQRGDVQFLILAICLVLSFVVPGCLLNKKAKENV